MNLQIIITGCRFILSVLGFLYAYYGIYVVVGLLFTRKFPKAKRLHKYGIVIAARNEENVIGQLLDSIKQQDYEGEVTVFVVADNCTDSTAITAREHGAICYERFDGLHRTKGYAMEFLFDNIKKDYGDVFEAFIMLDADNLLKSDYISRMNDAYDAGEKIVTSYRNTKNLGNSFIAASYAFHWMRTCRCENRAKSLIHTSCRIQGTGFLFDKALVENGWVHTTLTEDRSFCVDAVARGYRISYQDAAEFYDEQPESLSVAFRQRTRWAKGHLQAFTQLGPKLLRSFFAAFKESPTRVFACFDMLTICFPRSLASVILKAVEVAACTGLVVIFGGAPSLLSSLVIGIGIAFIKSCLLKIVTAAYLLVTEKRRLPQLSLWRNLLYCITFPIFDIIGKITYCMAAITHVEWTPIPHNAVSAAIK